MKLNYMISVLRTISFPGFYSIMKDWHSFIRMHFLFAAHESGLLQSLERPSTKDDILGSLQIKRPEILDALLDVGLALKELSCAKDVYRLKGGRSKALQKTSGDIISAMIQANVTYYSSVYREATGRMHDAPLADDLDEIGGLVARFSEIGEPFIRHFIAETMPRKGEVKILDVGCGTGKMLKTAHDVNQQANGVGIDIDSDVIEQTRVNLLEWRLNDRFEAMSGDILEFSSTNDISFSVIFLFNILYYFSSDERLQLFSQLNSLLDFHGDLVIAMHFRSNGKDLAAANLNMVNSSYQELMPLPDLLKIKSELNSCNFKINKIKKLIPGSTFYGIVVKK